MTEIRYKRWYEMKFTTWGSIYHNWYLVGPHGAVHVHIGQSGEKREREGWGPSGGIECHWNHYQPGFNRAPDHLECHVTKRPCWHDGSSMYVSDHIIPLLDLNSLSRFDHDMVFRQCEDWYRGKIDGQRLIDEGKAS